GEPAGKVSILVGKGDGTFQPAHSYAVGFNGRSVAAGDLNADGHLDLVVAGGAGVSVLLGNGDGTFQAAQNYTAGPSVTSVAIGDFSGHGHPDLAVASAEASYPFNGTVTILLGKGDGTFQQAAERYAAGLWPASV